MANVGGYIYLKKRFDKLLDDYNVLVARNLELKKELDSSKDFRIDNVYKLMKLFHYINNSLAKSKRYPVSLQNFLNYLEVILTQVNNVENIDFNMFEDTLYDLLTDIYSNFR